MSIELAFDLNASGIPWVADPRYARSLRQWAAALKEYLSLECPGASVEVHIDEKTRDLEIRVDGCVEEDEDEIRSKVADFIFKSHGRDAPSDDDFDPLRWALAIRADPNWLHWLALTTAEQRVREAAVGVLIQWLATGCDIGYDTAKVVQVLTSEGLLGREHIEHLLSSEHRFIREAAMMALPLLDRRREEEDAGSASSEARFLRCDFSATRE